MVTHYSPKKGTTQGDPLAMPMFALATIPLIKKLKDHSKQIWYADDAAAIGKLADLRAWLDHLIREVRLLPKPI